MKIRSWMLPLLVFVGVLLSTASGKYVNRPCRFNTDCGQAHNLQCIRNVCGCDSRSQVYDESSQKCLLLAGSRCAPPVTSTSHLNPNQKQTQFLKCIPNADCSKSVCTCRRGYRASLDSFCMLDFGSTCRSGSEDFCDESLGLVCTRGYCQCFNSTWSYHNELGCVHPKDPTYREMLQLINQTETLLKNGDDIDVGEVLKALEIENDQDLQLLLGSAVATKRQDTYNTNDLIFAAQETSETTAAPGGGGGSGRLFDFSRIRARIRMALQRFRNNRFVMNIRNFVRGSPGGYPEASTTTTPAPTYGPPPSGYGAPGQPEGSGGLLRQGRLMDLLRRLRMRFNFMRFVQNLRSRFRFGSTTAASAAPADDAPPPPPPPAEIQNPPPTVIESNGNFQNNPIFDNNDSNNNNADQPPSQEGQGTTRFLMQTRDRFRNLLRGSTGTQAGGYSNAGSSGSSSSPEGGSSPAGSSNYFTNNPPPSSHSTSFRVHQQEQFSGFIQSGSAGSRQSATQRYERQSNLQRPAFQSQQQQQHRELSPDQIRQQFSNFNNREAQASSHQPTTYIPRPQPSNTLLPSFDRPPSPHQPPSIYADSNTQKSFRLPIPTEPPLESPAAEEPSSQNYLLSEASEPRPGFAQYSNNAPTTESYDPRQFQQNYRDYPRFERVGHAEEEDEDQRPKTMADSWRETF